MGKGRCLLAYFICCGAPRLKNNSAMKTTIDRSLIISLIKDDLIHAKLVNGLISIGLDATHFHLYLGETIMELMGITDDRYGDRIFEVYLDLRKKVNSINLAGPPEALDNLSLEIFEALLKKVRTA